MTNYRILSLQQKALSSLDWHITIRKIIQNSDYFL